MTKPLLIELITEELPPKALRNLGQAFAESIVNGLLKAHLIAGDNASSQFKSFATPRRLAVCVDNVIEQAPDQDFAEKLMPVKVGLDANGEATPALIKKLASKGWQSLSVKDLSQESDGKQDYLIAKGTAPGAQLHTQLQDILTNAIDSLPIPKVMRYQLADGKTTVKFVRPAHALVALYGNDVIPVHALGLTADNTTHGHRFMGKTSFKLTSAQSYDEQLKQEGFVIASYDERLETIKAALNSKAEELNLTIGDDPAVNDLLEEVTSLVEHPTIYVGKFEEKFLSVPQECLILTMRLNQKYFPLFDKTTGKLSHQFLIVSNMQVQDPHNIIEGNERVVRPRLADAEFFFNTDRKQSLASRVPQLGTIVYHNKLGTQLARVERVQLLAKYIAQKLNANVEHADRAAYLAKADLTSNMVGEFPELQGVIGSYYAQGDNEPADVAQAIADQYLVKFDHTITSNNLTSVVLFIAERIETLVGIWGIGLLPTGERDPYALRRAALGIISAFDALNKANYFSHTDKLTLSDLLNYAQSLFAQNGITISSNTASEVQQFIYERLRNQLQGQYNRSVVDAVLALNPELDEVLARVDAVGHFTSLPEAESLAAANKRIGNLLKKVEGDIGTVNTSLLTDPAEIALNESINKVEPIALQHFEKAEFTQALQSVAATKAAVDAFFNDVMVMADDPAIRQNRLALLNRLHKTMNLVADLSKLAQ
ncbi:glycyl-tRNA synthetase subunit beta [Pelistega indica]|uniref:Glycine--tRNA ligase beta subunit n=1 Tax=Pelistega indica TaxID=1414851 RepID=V8G3C6_9BURK|nr:glycine--tRNA ligase subunit beta [Pelistega indica]ETD70187.1 glycyl-tRNA synthetase subunit beta [Pelistega indica]